MVRSRLPGRRRETPKRRPGRPLPSRELPARPSILGGLSLILADVGVSIPRAEPCPNKRKKGQERRNLVSTSHAGSPEGASRTPRDSSQAQLPTQDRLLGRGLPRGARHLLPPPSLRCSGLRETTRVSWLSWIDGLTGGLRGMIIINKPKTENGEATGLALGGGFALPMRRRRQLAYLSA